MTVGTMLRPPGGHITDSEGVRRVTVTCPWCGYERQARYGGPASPVCGACAHYERFAQDGGLKGVAS